MTEDDLKLYEGDIILPPQDKGPADLRNDGDVDGELRSKRNAVRDRKKLWLNKVVPYEFGYGFPGKTSETFKRRRQKSVIFVIKYLVF